MPLNGNEHVNIITKMYVRRQPKSYMAITVLIESPCPRDLKDERQQLDNGKGEVTEDG